MGAKLSPEVSHARHASSFTAYNGFTFDTNNGFNAYGSFCRPGFQIKRIQCLIFIHLGEESGTPSYYPTTRIIQ